MVNVLDRITELREARGWSEYQLSVKADLTQSTISSWYCKNMIPTIPSIQKICDAFEITIAQFFVEEDDAVIELTPQQRRLLAYSAKLKPEQVDALTNFLEQL